MKKVAIVTDSHSGIGQAEAKALGIYVLPMPFSVDGVNRLEDEHVDRAAFFEKLAQNAEVKTSQPAPGDVLACWDRALEIYDEVIYMPLSSGLSSSCATATMLAQDEPYAERVFVVDNGRIATPLRRAVMDALELAAEGYDGVQIKQMLEAERDNMSIYIAVDQLKYLQKGGRISATSAVVGTLLNVKPVLALSVGKLSLFKKCRGAQAAKKAMIEAMRSDLQTRFKTQYDRGEVVLMTACGADESVTQKWIEEVRAAFPGMDVLSDNLTLGICCHVGPGGLGIGCACRPRRIGKA